MNLSEQKHLFCDPLKRCNGHPFSELIRAFSVPKPAIFTIFDRINSENERPLQRINGLQNKCFGSDRLINILIIDVYA